MRTYFLLLTGLILLAFTACQNDKLVNGGNGNETAISLSVQLPDVNAPSTRAAGGGIQVSRCIMKIYPNDELYKREVSAVRTDGLTVRFDVRLVTSQTCNFIFWADHVASAEGEDIKADLYYNTCFLYTSPSL